MYAISLFVGYGYLGVGVGTEADFAQRTRAPIYGGLPDDRLRAPAGPRWDTGSWRVVSEEFLTERTKRALRRPLQACDAGGGIRMAIALARLRRTCVRAIKLLDQIPELPASQPLIAFVQEDDCDTPQTALLMLATVPRDTFRVTFPHWQRLTHLVGAARADADRMADLSARVAARERQFPKYADPAPDELTAALRDCGLRWHDVTTNSGPLRTALRVGSMLGASG